MLADILEVQLDRVRVEVVNRGDVRDILRVRDVAAPADIGITMNVQIESRAATAETLIKIREAAEASSAVLNMIRGGTAVAVEWCL